MKRVISILLAICMLPVLVSCSSKKLSTEDEERYREAIANEINERIQKFYEGEDKSLNEYFDYTKTKIEYTIDRIEKNARSDDYVVSITYNIIADVNKNDYTQTRLHLIGMDIGGFYSTIRIDNIKLTTTGIYKDDNIDYYYDHYTVLLNGEEIYNSKTDTEEYRAEHPSNNSDSSHSKDARKCKSCGKYYEPGDSGGNFMNIAKTGMCKNCYE